MRLLVIGAYYPFPPRVGSSIIAYHQMRELAKTHSVHFVCSDLEGNFADRMDFLDSCEFVARAPPSARQKWIQIARGVPPLVAECRCPEMQVRVSQLLARNSYDAMLIYGLMSVQYCPPQLLGRATVDIEDPQSMRLQRMQQLSLWTPWQRMKLRIHTQVMQRYERAVLAKLGRILVLSEADRSDLMRCQDLASVGRVPYGVDVRAPEEIAGWDERTEGMIALTGNMFHPPNVDGALHFLSSIFPLVLREHPSAVLWIVGARPDPRIRAAAAGLGDRVRITGMVPDIAKYMRRARVSICPIRLKIGAQTKILEALSWATPVVTTSAGNSGIGASSGRDLWIEDAPESFAKRVVGLLRGEDWARLSAAGQRFAREQFSWQRSAAELESQLVAL